MPTLEQRITELEEKVARLSGEAPPAGKDKPPPRFILADRSAREGTWLEQWFGAFKDDPTFDEAVKLGAEYRKSQPNAADRPECNPPHKKPG